SYKVGVNFGFKPEGNSQAATDTADSVRNEVYGWNPYLQVTAGDFSVLAEYMGAEVKNGSRAGDTKASPWCFHVIPSYMITKELEAVFRYSHIDTDNRGVNPSDGFRNMNSSGTFNRGNAY